ncbi:hypothetical protein M3936_16470 [Sutcliffiella horikoshii]|uniref:hypothetical protein n=1 Tax=Sutcliffiella horikoshii TaxID=79883 RepID=UPI002041C2E5|nr:hypothetical protein [Sutcliffiella horikoshii]MCM3619185.1 hypothetical protein [Sutcliffiella horikoshii]
MFRDIINRLEEAEIEILELRRLKAQAELLVSLILKQNGEQEVNFEDLKNVSFEKVKIRPGKKTTAFYEDN